MSIVLWTKYMSSSKVKSAKVSFVCPQNPLKVDFYKFQWYFPACCCCRRGDGGQQLRKKGEISERNKQNWQLVWKILCGITFPSLQQGITSQTWVSHALSDQILDLTGGNVQMKNKSIIFFSMKMFCHVLSYPSGHGLYLCSSAKRRIPTFKNERRHDCFQRCCLSQLSSHTALNLCLRHI